MAQKACQEVSNQVCVFIDVAQSPQLLELKAQLIFRRLKVFMLTVIENELEHAHKPPKIVQCADIRKCAARFVRGHLVAVTDANIIGSGSLCEFGVLSVISQGRRYLGVDAVGLRIYFKVVECCSLAIVRY